MTVGGILQKAGDEGGGLERGLLPLAVDLDGTLCRSDTLHDSLVGLLVARPLTAFSLPGWLRGGKAHFKAKVADLHLPDPSHLPYDPDVLDLVRSARSAGRKTVLISAADQRVVDAVAGHLGLFDYAIGSSGPESKGTNLSGAAKARWLNDHFGERRFDYVGDSKVDVPVWTTAQTAFAVRLGNGLDAAASHAGVVLEAVGPGSQPLSAWLRLRVNALRPHQWAKNLLVFVPIFAANQASGLGAALMAFLAFSLTASAVYIINDLADLAVDRAHPRKRQRPFAAGLIPVGQGLVMAGTLLALAFLVSLLFAPPVFAGILAIYLLTTFGYSLSLKRRTLVDIITLAGLYTLRIVGGAVATGVILSHWLMAFSMFIFFSLAAVKRQAELVDMERTSRKSMPGRGYVASDLPVIRSMAISSGQAAVLVLALYINGQDFAKHYREPAILWLVCPVVFYWLSRIQLLTHRGYMTDDPIVFAFRDARSLMAAVLVGAIVLLAVAGWGNTE